MSALLLARFLTPQCIKKAADLNACGRAAGASSAQRKLPLKRPRSADRLRQRRRGALWAQRCAKARLRPLPAGKKEKRLGRYRITVDTGGTFSDFVCLD